MWVRGGVRRDVLDNHAHKRADGPSPAAASAVDGAVLVASAAAHVD